MAIPYLVPALVTLRSEWDRARPGRSKSHDGWIGDDAHASRKSEHNPDGRGRVRAVDLTASGEDGERLSESARRHLARHGVRGYVIHAGRISNPSIEGGTWRRYTGSNPHTHHVHVTVLSDLTSTRSWSVGPPMAPSVTGKMDETTITALQWWVGAAQDGEIGPRTISSLQVKLASMGQSLGRADGDFGPRSARALEAVLAAPTETVPGWYPGLVRALQTRLAAELAQATR